MTESNAFTQSIFDTRFDELPAELPIFPLTGVMLLPGVRLPLNIFEPRYLRMIMDALKTSRMIGMIQPVGSGRDKVYGVGCAGRISSFNETEENRLVIVLTGVCRFAISEELDSINGYRRITPDWLSFRSDVNVIPSADTDAAIDIAKLKQSIAGYSSQHEINIDWSAFENTNPGIVVDVLATQLPFATEDKQALLESRSLQDRFNLLCLLCRASEASPATH
ncbi:MAG: LON peptidase substrate-binding domain-containing protein [Arenicellales bacterium WSBS_2016_MAG_OTU3]